MNFSSVILDSLQKNGPTSVSGFGTFYLKNTNAVVDQDTKNILPPGKEIAFNADFKGNAIRLANFISKEKNIPLIDAEIEVRKLVNFWNGTLDKEKELIVENLGTFSLDDSKVHFSGLRTENLSPDFYGLEQINISEIKKPRIYSKQKSKENSYQFSNSIWWVLPIILGIGAITYFGITQPEYIFGKKSFNNKLPDEKPFQKVVKDSLKVDSTKIKEDSIRTDSIEGVAITPKTSAKKWSSKNYSKSKWKKSKKRQNR